MKQPSRLTLVAVLAVVAGLLGLGIVWQCESSGQDGALTDAIVQSTVPQVDAIDKVVPMTAPAAGPRHEPAVSGVGWSTTLRQTEDYFEFVAAALKAAESGDGRAAYHIGTALSICSSIIRIAQRSPNPDEEYRRSYLNPSPNLPQWLQDKSRRDFQRCIRLAKEDVFAGLPPREGGYHSIVYWQDVAIKLGDPAAKTERAVSSLGRAADGKPTAEKWKSVEQAQSSLRDALRSKDSEVLFYLGLSLINHDYSAEPDRGVVLTLAACEMGYDCSGRTPLSYLQRCDSPEECDPSHDWRDTTQRDAGAKRYARLYARAQEVVDLFRREDWESLDAYVKLDGRISEKYELSNQR